MFDGMNRVGRGYAAVPEWQPSFKVTNDVDARQGSTIDADGAWLLVGAAADVDHYAPGACEKLRPGPPINPEAFGGGRLHAGIGSYHTTKNSIGL
jgi:hypothetical protein